MTNDRTAASIRRHLLETAEERPADGQLDAVLAVTARARQRSRWEIVARGLLDRWVGWSRTSVRLSLVAALLAVAIAGIGVIGGGGSGGRTAFEGTWTSIDPADGSVQTLVVGAGPAPTVTFRDAFASACAQAGDTSTSWISEGVGQVSLDRLAVQFPGGGCLTWHVPRYVATYDHDPVSDTLLDGDKLRWHRQP